MPKKNKPNTINLTAGGGAVSLPCSEQTVLYNITNLAGGVTLTGSWTIAPSGAPIIGDTFDFYYDAYATLGAFSISIFGRSLTKNEALAICYIHAIYVNGGVPHWQVDITKSNNDLTDEKIKTDANDPTAGYLDAKIDSSLTIDPVTHKMGVVAAISDIYYIEKTLTHYDIIVLNSTPIIGVPAPGVGKAIVEHKSIAELINWTVPYNLPGDFWIKTDTANTSQARHIYELLTGTVDKIVNIPHYVDTSVTVAYTQILENKALMIQSENNPTGGSSNNILKIGIWYSIINV